jgi:hypothetical protein
MLTGAERLDGTGLDRMLLGIRAGDPDDEVLGAWLAKESVRDVYLTEDLADAGLLLDKAIEGCATDAVDEVRSLGRTLGRWRTEILNHHATSASNGPTEGLNLLVKKVKRAGRGFRSFVNTGYGSCCTPAGWTGRGSDPRRRASEPALPSETGRASYLSPLHVHLPGPSQPTSRAGPRRLRAEPRRDWARR